MRHLAWLALALCLWNPSMAQELQITAEELPRIPPKSPEEAIKTFAIKDGFRIELAASEPLTTDPVAISFDALGRMFTCEMRGYSERREDALGRVRMLTDDNGDGRYDRATTFADGLKWPTGIVCWGNGVFVGAAPDIWWFGDTNGDGVADEKKVVFTGFGATAGRLNVQALLNSFVWGPDWRIHGTASRHGGTITRPGVDDFKPVRIPNSCFSFDPGKLDLRAEPGSAQYGMTFGDDGMRFVCSNSSHIEAVMVAWPWNRLGLPKVQEVIPIDGPSAEVYRTSPVEPWRVVRTRWRVQGRVRGPIEGGGRDSGYFTSASGLCIYRGTALPEAFRGNEFVGDVGSNLVHRKLITKSADRIHLEARRPADELQSEFLTSTDNWFRPVMCTNGPDGALYIVDMYRETIEHPWSLPEPIKSHLDLNSGNDRGRIWRVLPKKFARPEIADLIKLSTKQLVHLLGHSNGWHRDMAAQLLHQRGESDALPGNTVGGLYGLAASGKLEPATLEGALRSGDPALQRHALRLAAEVPVNPTLLPDLAASEDPWVRFEAALLLCATEHYPSAKAPLDILVSLARRSPRDEWIQHALVQAAVRRRQVSALFERAWEHQLGAALLTKLAAKVSTDEANQVGSLIARSTDIRLAAEILRALPQTPDPARIKPLIDLASAQLTPDAVWLRSVDPSIPAGTFWDLVETDPALGNAALDAAKRSQDWKAQALSRWSRLPSGARSAILRQLNSTEILNAVEAGTLQPAEIAIPVRATMLSSSNEETKRRATKLFGAKVLPSREEAARHYRPALNLEGDGAKGEAIFDARCHQCHEKPGSTEANAGPALTSFVNKGPAALLENLIAPNKEVAPQFLSWQVTQSDGATHVGLLASEQKDKIVLQLPGRQTVAIERSKIKATTNLNTSLMPPGLEAGLTLQQMADLLAFLSNPVRKEVKAYPGGSKAPGADR